MAREISANKDELRQSEERFKLLVESVRDYAIFMLSPTAVVLAWNAGAEHFKGYRANQRRESVDQMILEDVGACAAQPGTPVVTLGVVDVPEMLALSKVT